MCPKINMDFLKDIFSAPQNKLMYFPKKQDLTRSDEMTHNVDASRVFLSRRPAFQPLSFS